MRHFTEKLMFETQKELHELLHAVHSGCMYWQKQKQYAQGKVMLSAEGEASHYSVEYCEEQRQIMNKVYDTVNSRIE